MGISKWFKNLLGIDTEEDAASESTDSAATPVAAPVVALPMDEEEKNLVAVIAACIGGKDQPDAQLHIQKITRIQ